ncbi:VOC family protein [Actinocorallia libanotica]|uniref:VOC family protein n=1 Tax=Actinocorallia libanotica TaxID=46162 RepID=A0ABN1RYK9_9ACTN
MNTPQPQVWPTLQARDARRLIAFLVEAFGFEETAVHGEGDVVQHAELAWPPGGGIMLGSVRDDSAAVFRLAPGSFGAYAVTDEPDALYERALKAGATVVRELGDTDYGSRDFIVRDPEGNLWSFGTYRGAPRP